MRGVLVPDVRHPSGGESNRKNSAVHETKITAGSLIDRRARSDFVKSLKNGERITRIFRKRSVYGIQCFKGRIRRKH